MIYNLLRNILLIVLLLSLSSCAALVVGGAATSLSVAHDRRSAGAVIDDQGIELKALKELINKDYYSQSHIVIVSYNGRVLVTGQVPSKQARRNTIQTIAKIPKVNKVHDNLTIGPAISLQRRSKDTWITGKVKAGLITKDNIDPTRIKVVTENATVYLLGIVNRKEALLASDVAREVSGVFAVIRVFEYVE